MNDDEITVKENEDRRRIMREQSEQISKQGAWIAELEAELERVGEVGRRSSRLKERAEKAEAERDKLRDACKEPQPKAALGDGGEKRGMGKFRKKPVIIEAFQWMGKGTEYPIWASLAVSKGILEIREDHFFINTLEGKMRGGLTDWVILGVQEELYPCKPDIFKATYERV